MGPAAISMGGVPSARFAVSRLASRLLDQLPSVISIKALRLEVTGGPPGLKKLGHYKAPASLRTVAHFGRCQVDC